MALKTIKIGNSTLTVQDVVANRLIAANQAKLSATGTPILFGESFRTRERQADLFAKSQRGEIGRAAPPGSSFHETGKAVDVVNPDDSAKYLNRFGLNNDLKGDRGHFSIDETRVNKYKKFVDNIERGRQVGLTDTQLLDKLAQQFTNFKGNVANARQSYEKSSTIKNDRDLLNFLSMKFSGKMPTVESVAEKTEFQKELLSGKPEEKPTFFQPSPEGVRFRDVVREGFGVGRSVIKFFRDRFGEAKDEQKDLARREDEGEINKLAEFVGKAGVGADVVLDIGYNTLVQSVKGLGLLSEKISGTEGTIDEAQKQVVNKAIDFFNTETGKSVLEIVEAGEETWKKFEESNPSLAEIVKGSAKVSELALIGSTKASREAVRTVVEPSVKAVRTTAAVTGEALETTGKKLITGVERQLVREAENIVSPKITKNVKDLALRQGRIDKKGKYTLSAFEKEVAEVSSPFIKKGNTPQKNISNIVAEIKRESEGLAKVLEKNDAIFNTNQLKANIKESLKGVDDVLIDEKRLAKAKDDIVELLMAEVKTKKLSTLWEARKKFDRILDDKLNAFAGVSTIKKDISLAIRQSVNDFIVKKSPQLVKDGKHPFSDAMSKMHRLYSAEKNIANKVLPSQLDQTVLGGVGRKLKSISHKVGAIQGAAAVVGIYSLGQALFNPAVIGAILAYGSYKVGKTVITSKMLRKAVGTALEQSGKLLNPQEKRYLKDLSVALDKAIKKED